MEWHKGSLFQRRTEGLRAGIRQGQEKNGTARGSWKNNFPTLPRHPLKNEGGVQMKMAAGAPAPARALTISSVCFVQEPFSEAPIIQLIWGNSSMLCKRLSVAMVRNPWRPPPTQPPLLPSSLPPPSSSAPSPPPLHKPPPLQSSFLHRNFRVRQQRERGGGGLGWGRERYGAIEEETGGGVELISRVWLEAKIQEQQVKSGSRGENTVCRGRGTQIASDRIHDGLLYFNLKEEMRGTSLRPL